MEGASVVDWQNFRKFDRYALLSTYLSKTYDF